MNIINPASPAINLPTSEDQKGLKCQKNATNMIIEPSVSQLLVESTQATWEVSVNNFWHLGGLVVTSNSPNAKLRTNLC